MTRCHQVKGTPAGTARKDGYRIVKVDGKNYTTRQCVWIYHNGNKNVPWKLGVKDGDGLNDRIENITVVMQEPEYKKWLSR